MNHRIIPGLTLSVSLALFGVATARTIETFTFASASVSLTSGDTSLRCSHSDGTATAAEVACDSSAPSPNAGDPSVTTAVSSARA